jgi:ribosomal protein L21E
MITLLSGYQMKKPSTKAGKTKKVSKVMKEFKAGSLHSGKGGKVVKSPKQAIAIALSEAGMAKKKGK